LRVLLLASLRWGSCLPLPPCPCLATADDAAPALTNTPSPQAEAASLREAAAASAATASTRGEECEALRGALAAVEGRLVEYQQKDVEVRGWGGERVGGGLGRWGWHKDVCSTS
jgi:hypothetical protein